jgi:hypothetical protein
MLHELGHAYFNYLHYRIDTFRQYGEYVSWGASEVFSFEFAFKIGGNPYLNQVDYGRGLMRINGINDSRFHFKP